MVCVSGGEREDAITDKKNEITADWLKVIMIYLPRIKKSSALQIIMSTQRKVKKMKFY